MTLRNASANKYRHETGDSLWRSDGSWLISPPLTLFIFASKDFYSNYPLFWCAAQADRNLSQNELIEFSIRCPADSGHQKYK